MSYRTILVYLDKVETASTTLTVATELADKHNAHLIGLYVVPSLEVYVSAELPIPPVMAEDHRAYHRKACDDLKHLFDTATANQNFVAEWREVNAIPFSVAEVITEIAHTVDLVVIAQKDEEAKLASQRDLPEGVVLDCGRPVIVVPLTNRYKTVATDVFVAWDGGNQATRAVFDALPILQQAQTVTVHRVNPSHYDRHRMLSLPAELVNTLSRHGVNVNLSESDARGSDVGEEIIRYVNDKGADLMVMGAYGRARLREYLFGGTSRTVFKEMPVPVLMSH